MRELYFSDTIDDAEYNGKLYGLGQTFTVPNGIDHSRGSAATIAEREDRGIMRDVHSGTPGPVSSHSAGLGMNSMTTPTMGGSIPSSMPGTPYGPMGGNNPYMRAPIGVGGR